MNFTNNRKYRWHYVLTQSRQIELPSSYFNNAVTVLNCQNDQDSSLIIVFAEIR